MGKNKFSECLGISVRLHVLTVVDMKLSVFSDVAPCSLTDIDRSFKGSYCLHHQGYESSHGANIPEDSQPSYPLKTQPQVFVWLVLQY
jgi:hypothetical protein